MNRRTWVWSLIAAALLVGAGWGLYAVGMQRGMRMAAADHPPSNAPAQAASNAGPLTAADGEEATRRHLQAGLKAGDIDPATGQRILYYHDPMAPATKFDKPGKSPFMSMMLVPVYAGGASDRGNVTVSPRIQQSLGVRTAIVTEGTLSPQVSAVGSIAFNERDQVVVQARASGYVERLHVRATLDRVAKGQPLVDLYIPDWVAAQEEFLSVRRMQGTDLAVLVDGARQRMRQVGMTDDQIRLVESSGRTQPRTTFSSPIGGVVVELTVREGMALTPGVTLFRISGLSTVWANAEVPESQAALLRPGATVEARTPAVPGTVFKGKVQAILPDVSAATRTLKARMEIANAGYRLVPGMFVQMQFTDKRADKMLLVPTEAVIQTGRRAVVMLAEPDGRFRPVQVEPGIESGGQTEIKGGLAAGQRVVVSSQFLIDSEASLRGLEGRLGGEPGSARAGPASVPASAPRHVGEAKVERVGKDALTLSHGPIPSLGWSAMTMDFMLPAGGLPIPVKPGDKVRFEFLIDKDNEARLTSVAPAAAASKAAGSAGTSGGQR
jgi:Cu(I)/Ag(I) efflux system membrane fusion protein